MEGDVPSGCGEAKGELAACTGGCEGKVAGEEDSGKAAEGKLLSALKGAAGMVFYFLLCENGSFAPIAALMKWLDMQNTGETSLSSQAGLKGLCAW